MDVMKALHASDKIKCLGYDGYAELSDSKILIWRDGPKAGTAVNIAAMFSTAWVPLTSEHMETCKPCEQAERYEALSERSTAPIVKQLYGIITYHLRTEHCKCAK